MAGRQRETIEFWVPRVSHNNVVWGALGGLRPSCYRLFWKRQPYMLVLRWLPGGNLGAGVLESSVFHEVTDKAEDV